MYNLLLSGGGLKGLLHLGALKALEEKNLLKDIKNYGGASIGSIIALLLCIGYNYNDIMIIILKINMNKFYDITDVFELLNIYGLMNWDPCERFLRLLLETKFKKKNISFKELYELTSKTLHINAINVNTTEEIIFNHINYPDIDIVDACLASSSLPFLFSPRIINDNHYIDPFTVNNCPYNIFSNDLENTICLSINDFLNKNTYTKIDSFQNYIMNVFNSLKNYNYNNNVKRYKPRITINLYYDCSPIDFDLSKELLSEIFIKGYKTTISYIDNEIDNEIETNEIDKVIETNEIDKVLETNEIDKVLETNES